MAQYLYESYRQGIFLRVTAICADTGEEAIAFGPAKDEVSVIQLARQKLKFKLNPKIAKAVGLRV